MSEAAIFPMEAPPTRPGRVMPMGRRFEAGNPGKPKGARHQFGEGFLRAMYESFQVHGVDTIEIVRKTDPVAYLKVCASLLPKEVVGPDGGPVQISGIQVTFVRPSPPQLMGPT